MRIYRMSATFGKLDHQTLTLKPGLNIITAPNEWGKSTWCAFLVAMLYGIDTRSKTTKSALADKDRYAPWSGQPMEGRIDLNWNGRDITVERKTTRRIPLGDFTAYETHTGITVPELTAANCGQMLLGVEQSVFRRAGFIRHSDLPVTQDEALRRRLNDLVTTGDESGAADRLAGSLKELRNKIRYNRTGLLPQAETECQELEATLAELEALHSRCAGHREQIAALKEQIAQLDNHLQALEYRASRNTAARIADAQAARDAALAELTRLEAACAGLPPQDQVRQQSQQLNALQEELLALQPKISQLPPEPKAPPAPAAFAHISLEEARRMVYRDAKEYVAAKRTTVAVALIVMGILGLLASGMLIFLKAYLFALAAACGSLAALIWGVYEKGTMARRVAELRKKYGSDDQSRWALPLTEYEKRHRQYIAAAKTYREATGDIQIRLNSLNDRMEALCGSESPDAIAERLNRASTLWEAFQAARREAERTQAHLDALQAAVKTVPPPAREDTLTLSAEETAKQLDACGSQLHQLQNLLGQCQGRMETLGDSTVLERALEQKRRRISTLRNTYTAIVIAQDTLVRAKEELQRRFAPRITGRAQQLMSAMTDGRYCQLSMDTEFSLRALTQDEETLRDVLWRSDGTVDQLYLALRLAVAEELTPDAPLVLDDALVRFDDRRMEAAVGILEEMSRHRQIILFTCQGREQQA